jgi:hypothetical protein
MSTATVATRVTVKAVSISQPDASDVRVVWAKDAPGLTPGAALVALAPGVTLHLQTELDTLDAPYLDTLITALISVRERMPEAVSYR